MRIETLCSFRRLEKSEPDCCTRDAFGEEAESDARASCGCCALGGARASNCWSSEHCALDDLAFASEGETLISLALFFLASLGLSFILGFSKISLPLRILLGGRPAQFLPLYGDASNVPTGTSQISKEIQPLVPVVGPWLVALVECPGCLGWHLGWLGFVFRAQLHLPLDAPFWPGLIIFACATAATNMIGARAIGLLE